MWNILNYKVPDNKIPNNKKDVDELENIAYASSDLNGAKKQTKNHTVYRTALAILLPLLPVSDLSCRTPTKVEEPTPTVAPRNYNKDLEAALGARWKSLNDEQKDMFRNGWGATEEDIIRFMVNIYSNPEKMYNSLSPDQKRQLDAFVSKLDKKRVSEYEKAFPWINPEQLTLSDKLLIDWIEGVGYFANLR